MAKPSGEIIETPITANFREGLIRAPVLHLHARSAKGTGGHGPQNSNSGYLTRRLVDVAQGVVITDHDCGTMDGSMSPLWSKGGDHRVDERTDPGRVALEDIVDPFTREVIVQANDEIEETLAEKIDESGIER